MGSKLEHQGKDQVLIFCREVEALPLPPTAIFQETGQFSQVQEPRLPASWREATSRSLLTPVGISCLTLRKKDPTKMAEL